MGLKLLSDDTIARLTAQVEGLLGAQQEILRLVLQTTQIQAEVSLRMTALHEHLLVNAPTPRVWEPEAAPEGEAFGWDFSVEDLTRDPRADS